MLEENIGWAQECYHVEEGVLVLMDESHIGSAGLEQECRGGDAGGHSSIMNFGRMAV